MSTILSCITPLYNSYGPKLEKNGHTLDLNLKDPTIEVESPKTISAILRTYLDFIHKTGFQAKITIVSNDKYIILKDSNTMIPDSIKDQILGFDGVKVSSRVGFGTKIKILINY